MADSNAKEQQGTVIKADRPNWQLIAAGILLVLLCMGGVVFARLEGGETTETVIPASTAGGSSNLGTTEKTTKTKASPSDTLLTAILVSGAALIISGALYSRISTITLPGGASIGLTNKETATTKDTVKKELKGKTTIERSAATAEAIEKVREKKSKAGAVELPPDDVKEVVRAAIQRFK